MKRFVLGLALALAVAPSVRAAERPSVASDAQPGLYRVALAEGTDPALAATLGYGFTESQGDGDGAHHRLSLRLAGAAAVLPWLSIGPIVDGRYDIHPDDSGTVIDAALALRLFASSGNLHFGAELKPWVPGAGDASTTFGALSLDSRLLVGAKLGSVTLAAHGGYRLDRGAEAGKNAAELGSGDRLALGLSDFDAVLVGIGAGFLVGKTELLLEASGDVLVGNGAPPFAESPLRVTGGVRHPLSGHIALEFLVDASLSKRPELGPTAPLVPIEPRVSALVGLRYVFGGDAQEPVKEPAKTQETAPTPVAVPPPSESSLEVVLTDERGAPVENATISLTVGATARELGPSAPGHYRDEHLPLGAATLSVRAPDFQPLEQTLELRAGAPIKLELKLADVVPPSQVRGVVRSFGGQGLPARIRVMPLGLEAATDASGAFQIDVPPGSYEVVIEAAGYESQKRQVSVDPQGVVILNADLQKKKGGK